MDKGLPFGNKPHSKSTFLLLVFPLREESAAVRMGACWRALNFLHGFDYDSNGL